MADIFMDQKLVTAGIFIFQFFSIFLKLLMGTMYAGLIKETENMACTTNRILRQCKTKFTHVYEMNKGMSNVPVFVDKFLSRMSLGPFSFHTLNYLARQSMLFSVFFAGLGICRAIIHNRSFSYIKPLYIVSFVGIYLYFTVSGAVDLNNKVKVLKLSLTDYFENHLVKRIPATKKDLDMLYGENLLERANSAESYGENTVDRRKAAGKTGKVENVEEAEENPRRELRWEELEDLLKEFLVE